MNYGVNKVRFPAPVPVGSRLRAHFEVLEANEVDNNGVQFVTKATVEREGTGEARLRRRDGLHLLPVGTWPMDAEFAELQTRLRQGWPHVTLRSIGEVERVLVVVHSISFDAPDQLIPVFPAYEERFLCLVLSLLRAPGRA